MWVSDKWRDFELLDCSRGEKLERWGNYTVVRPDPQAIWDTPRSDSRWRNCDGRYSRSSSGGGAWDRARLPQSWQIGYGELRFNIKPRSFKHTGLFPEQASNWDYIMRKIRGAGREISVLNLFAYTGAATVAALAAGPGARSGSWRTASGTSSASRRGYSATTRCSLSSIPTQRASRPPCLPISPRACSPAVSAAGRRAGSWACP